MTEPSKPDAEEVIPLETDSHLDDGELSDTSQSDGDSAIADTIQEAQAIPEGDGEAQAVAPEDATPLAVPVLPVPAVDPAKESPLEPVAVTEGKGGVSPAWKTASLVLAAGFIFAVGLLVGQKSPQPHAADPGLTRESETVRKDDAKSAAVAGVPSAISDIVAEVAPSVVTIELTPIRQHNHEQNGLLGNVFPNGNPMANLPQSPQCEAPEMGLAPPPKKSLGTGVILRADGYILTSAHVLHRNSTIKVAMDDGRKLPAEVVGRDNFSDLAVVKVAADDLPVARFGTTKNLRAGDWAIAIGSPLGFEHTVTLGIISAVGRSINDDTFRNRVDLIQTDAAINMGNSGGPLLNIKGDVIGINTAIRGDAQNISFAIPVDEARKVALELIEHGEIPRPYLGIFMQDLNPDVPHQGIPESLKGVLVSQVMASGPSDKAGLGRGDVIQQIDGKPVDSVGEIRRITRDKKPGDEFEVEFWRRGTTQTRKVVVGKYPSTPSTGSDR